MFLFGGLFIWFLASSLSIFYIHATPLTSISKSLEQSACPVAPGLSNLIEARADSAPAPSSPDPGGSDSDPESDPGPSNRGTYQLHPGPGPRPSSILSAWFQLPPGWSITGWQTRTTFLPATSAARELQAFYQDLFETAASRFWEGNSSPVWRFTSAGLSFWVSYHSGDDVDLPFEDQPHMSLAILSSIAFSLIEVTRRGFVGTYIAYIVDPDGHPFWIELEQNGSP